MTHALTPIPGGALWLPGTGVTGTDERAAAKAVEEYDSALVLGQRKDSSEWVVFLRKGPDAEPFPVFGLGTRLPSVDEIKRRLYNADVRKHGAKIVRDIARKQEAAQKEIRNTVAEADELSAEALVHGFRKMGFNPYPRIFVPRSIKDD